MCLHACCCCVASNQRCDCQHYQHCQTTTTGTRLSHRATTLLKSPLQHLTTTHHRHPAFTLCTKQQEPSIRSELTALQQATCIRLFDL